MTPTAQSLLGTILALMPTPHPRESLQALLFLLGPLPLPAHPRPHPPRQKGSPKGPGRGQKEGGLWPPGESRGRVFMQDMRKVQVLSWENDGSKGVHNPTYTRAVLLATLNALQ